MSITPLPDGITSDLEALRLALAQMSAGDLSSEQTRAIAAEISAIRLHLKRLARENQELRTQLNRALDS